MLLKLKMNSLFCNSQEPFGAVYCVTKDKELVRIDDKYLFSNGLAVLHNKEGKPSKLIVAETRKQTLWQYDILGPGKVAKKTLFGKLPSKYTQEAYD